MAEVIETKKSKTARYVIDLSTVTCPACGRSDRWEAMTGDHPEGNNPQISVWCDCGVGELLIVVE